MLVGSPGSDSRLSSRNKTSNQLTVLPFYPSRFMLSASPSASLPVENHLSSMSSVVVDDNIQRIEVEGYEAFSETISELENKKRNIFVFFSSARDKDGKNWCPDCETAEPIVNRAVLQMPPGSTYIRVSVGSPPEWKDKCNKFRTDSRTNLTGIPTLVSWLKDTRLGVDECKQENKVVDLVQKE